MSQCSTDRLTVIKPIYFALSLCCNVPVIFYKEDTLQTRP